MLFWTLESKLHALDNGLRDIDQLYAMTILKGAHLPENSDCFAQMYEPQETGESATILLCLFLRYTYALMIIKRLAISKALLPRFVLPTAEKPRDIRIEQRFAVQVQQSDNVELFETPDEIPYSPNMSEDDTTMINDLAKTVKQQCHDPVATENVEEENKQEEEEEETAATRDDIAFALQLRLFKEILVKDPELPVLDAVIGYRFVLCTTGFNEHVRAVAWRWALNPNFPARSVRTTTKMDAPQLAELAARSWQEAVVSAGELLQHIGRYMQMSIDPSQRYSPEFFYDPLLQLVACLPQTAEAQIWDAQLHFAVKNKQIEWASRALVQEIPVTSRIVAHLECFFNHELPDVQLSQMFEAVSMYAVTKGSVAHAHSIAEDKRRGEIIKQVVEKADANDKVVQFLNRQNPTEAEKKHVYKRVHVDWLSELRRLQMRSDNPTHDIEMSDDRYGITPYGTVRLSAKRIRDVVQKMQSRLAPSALQLLKYLCRQLLFHQYLQTRSNVTHPGQSPAGAAILQYARVTNAYACTADSVWHLSQWDGHTSLFSAAMAQFALVHRNVFFQVANYELTQMLMLARYDASDIETKAIMTFCLLVSLSGGTGKSYQTEHVKDCSIPNTHRSSTMETQKFLAQSHRPNQSDIIVTFDEIAITKLIPDKRSGAHPHEDNDHKIWLEQQARRMLNFHNLLLHKDTGERRTEHHCVLTSQLSIGDTNKVEKLQDMTDPAFERIIVCPLREKGSDFGGMSPREAEQARVQYQNERLVEQWINIYRMEQLFMFEKHKMQGCDVVPKPNRTVSTTLWPLLHDILSRHVGYLDKGARGQHKIFDMADTIAKLSALYFLYRAPHGASPFSGRAHEWDEERLEWLVHLYFVQVSHLFEAVVVLRPNWFDPIEPRLLAAIYILYQNEFDYNANGSQSYFAFHEGKEYLYMKSFEGRTGERLCQIISTKLQGHMAVSTALLSFVLSRWSRQNHNCEFERRWCLQAVGQAPHWEERRVPATTRHPERRAYVKGMLSQRAVLYDFLIVKGAPLANELKDHDAELHHEQRILKDAFTRVLSYRHQRNRRVVVGTCVDAPYKYQFVDLNVQPDGNVDNRPELVVNNPMCTENNDGDLANSGFTVDDIESYKRVEVVTCDLDYRAAFDHAENTGWQRDSHRHGASTDNSTICSDLIGVLRGNAGETAAWQWTATRSKEQCKNNCDPYWLGAPVTIILEELSRQSHYDIDDKAERVAEHINSFDEKLESSEHFRAEGMFSPDADFFQEHYRMPHLYQDHEVVIDDINELEILFAAASERNQILPPRDVERYPKFLVPTASVQRELTGRLGIFVTVWNRQLYRLTWPTSWISNSLLRQRIDARLSSERS